MVIRLGKKLGFNFNEHKNKKIGYLREFVRINKHQLSKIKDSKYI